MSASEKPLPPRSKNLTIVAILLGAIAVLNLVGLLTSGIRIGQPAMPQGMQPGQMPRQGNFQPGGGNFQQRGAPGGLFSLFGAARSLGIDFQYIRYVSMAIALIGIVLVLVAVFFIWKQRRWALNLGIVLAILILLGALPGLFSLGGRFVDWIPTSLNALKAFAAIPVIVLGILPSVRDSVR